MTSSNSRLYFFANWKMYLDHLESLALAEQLKKEASVISKGLELVVFPSALSLAAVSQTLSESGIAVGAQNVYWTDRGGYTGEISSSMAQAVGARYVLIGHSERRHIFKETNHEVRQKLEAALTAGLTPVLCVGETKEEKMSGQTIEVIEAQLRSAYMDLSWPAALKVVVAYEPVWAISTGNACEPVAAGKTAQRIQPAVLALTKREPIVLYGGSVRPNNVKSFVAETHIQGVLVGQASVNYDSWKAIADELGA